MIFSTLISKAQSVTVAIEPWWTIALVPLWQEFIFRYIPFIFWYLPVAENFWLIGLITSLAFALIHWYFGKWFVVYSFVWGLAMWWVMVQYGFLAVVIIHAIVSMVHWKFGFIEWKAKLHRRPSLSA